MSSRDDMVLTPSLEGKATTARRVGSTYREKFAAVRRGAAARGGVRSLAGMAARGAAVASVVALATLIVIRIYTGRTFENMGQVLKDKVFGDLSDQDLAKIRAMERVTSNARLAEAMSVGGAEQAQPTFELYRQQEFNMLRGMAIGRRRPEFTANTTLEQLSLSGWESIQDLHVLQQAANALRQF